jgi:hypothetical protein
MHGSAVSVCPSAYLFAVNPDASVVTGSSALTSRLQLLAIMQ